MDGSNLLAALPDYLVLAQAAGAASARAAEAVSGQTAATGGFNFAKAIFILGAFAVIVLPFIIGPILARKLKMPAHSTSISFILLSIIASTAILAKALPKLGVDLRGGTILVYEMDPTKLGSEQGNSRVLSENLVEPLTNRINPAGTQEIVIRPYGESQIEVIVPEVDQTEVDRIKRVIEEAGILRFAIVANRADHQSLIGQAAAIAESDNAAVKLNSVIRDAAGAMIGFWATVDRESGSVDPVRPLRVGVQGGTLRNPQTGEMLDLPSELFQGLDANINVSKYIDAQKIPGLEILMVVDPELDVTGKDLDFASSSVDQSGRPAVSFRLNDDGSSRFYVLTLNNAPSGSMTRSLGIVLDDRLLSAPNINDAIRKDGIITGNFTRQEVDSLVQILRAGQLPAALTPQPIAENVIDATLGTDTIRNGLFSMIASIVSIFVFMIYYYRFSGVVACIAVVMNLALTLATMVLINQPMSLPGLAGMVLGVGMSVDANILIYERIREEIRKGSAPRMAIRNGFSRATITIVDSNLTTLITAVVLYLIGTDQIRGFAVTLILGLVFSMFTAISVARTIFDLAERHGFLSLSMSDGVNTLCHAIAGPKGFDFVGRAKPAILISAVLMIGSVVAIVARGNAIFDIDFAGGSSIQFGIQTPAKTDEIREILGEDFTVNGVTMEGAEPNTVYKVDSALENVTDLQTAVVEAFAKSNIRLKNNKVQVLDKGQSKFELKTPGMLSNANGIRLVSAQADDKPSENGQSGAAAAATASTIDATVKTEDPKPALNIVTRTLQFGEAGDDATSKINASTLKEAISRAAKEIGETLSTRVIQVNPIGDVSNWTADSSLKYSKWDVSLPLEAAQVDKVLGKLTQSMNSTPVWISSSSIGKQVAGDMIGRGLMALFASLVCIGAYVWFRFHRPAYSVAAVLALVHDVLITLGAIAASFWVADALEFLKVDQFKVSLTVLAALLTIIGYSLNDTIVVFDRIRETKGKAPRLTSPMVNDSVNQTLSRTILTSATTLAVAFLLFVFGGEGIHAFAFAFVIGVAVGTYSSVFVASPILLWITSRDPETKRA
jgi:SecD/SecF fusion protein